MKWDEVFDKVTGIQDDDKARRVLNVSTRIANVTAEELETGVTLERLSEIGVPVFRYQTQVTIHGRLPDFNPETRPGGYKAVFRNQNGSIGVKYSAVDLPKKLALEEACELTHKTRGWNAHRDSTGFQLQRGFGDDKDAAVACLKAVPRDLFIGSAYGARDPWTGRIYIVVEIAAVPVEHLAALVTWFTGATAEQLAAIKQVKAEADTIEHAAWEARWAEEKKQAAIEEAQRAADAKAFAAAQPMQPLACVPTTPGKFRRVAIGTDGKPYLKVIELAKRGACLCYKAGDMTKWRAVKPGSWEAACKAGLLFPAEDAPRTVAVPKPLTLGVNEITVFENVEKNGVEIRFPSKPDASVLDALKGAGWRWSRFNGVWYNRATDANREFANQLAGNAPVATGA